MAKLGFKDILMKYLKKDEAFKVKYAMNPNQKIAVATYNDRADAEKFVSDIIKKGGKAILTQEDAPANATGTAVAGTGDDSSTVVVKKKKELQKNLMRRMGIKEAIDRAIPDLEYPKDEIRERTDQLKQLALESDYEREQPAKVKKAIEIAKKMAGNYTGATREIEKIATGLSRLPVVKSVLMRVNEDLNKDDEKTIKPIIKQLKKSVAAHDAQAKQLQKDISDDLDRQPQDKDVKSKPGTQPKKYYKKMSKSDKEKRAAHFAKQKYSKTDKDSDYKAAPGDKDAKTKKSIHTKKFKQMYGEELLDEKIKGIENKAKKSGMPYGILKKVYDRGMAAWRGGHRPGATQQQWAFARVNSFVTKSSGTWGGADKDLAKKVRGSK